MPIVFDEVSATVESARRPGDEEQQEDESRHTAVPSPHALSQLRRELERLHYRKARLQAD
jgi:hypothetical protein